MSKPIRIQLSRKQGFKLPSGTVNCARPGKWGNPFKKTPDVTNHYVVACFRDFLREHPEYVEKAKRELHGKNLACWCKPTDECHCDVLLEIANSNTSNL